MSVCMLIIEDHPANLKLMVYLLKAFGYTLLTAEDGEEGLAMARRELPDLIVCDVQLPGLNGYEIAQRLKSDPALRTIPLIAVTALAMVGDRDKVMAAGFDGYICKPIKPRTFVEEVEAFLLPGQVSIQPPQRQTSQAALPEKPPATDKRITILVVDNEPHNINLACSILESFGYQVLTASGGNEALALAQQSPPDLILSDVNMLEGTGQDFLKAVKADPHLNRIPFLFITSTSRDAKSHAEGVALGADRFIFRPIEALALLAEIEACLQERKGD